ncbi:MAG: response regulator transcription factor [Caldilineaceae bacterium]|nr:response regulator transcription factor [Caldilineaceae bacterium]
MIDLLLIDDDANLTELLGNYLGDRGYAVRIAHNGAEGVRMVHAYQPALVVLDVSMPVRDGWYVLQRIRELSTVPVLMVTAQTEEENVLRGFALGADDYVAKPFSFAELTARITAVLNRVSRTEAVQSVEIYGELTIDLTDKRVWRGGELIHLTPTEFKLLAVLIRQAGHVISQEELVRQAWGEQYLEDIGYVRRYVWHLRRKIELDPNNPRYIHNDRGYGYRFEVAGVAVPA